LLVALLIAIALTFQPVADVVAKPFNTAGILVKSTAETVFLTLLGLLIILLGVKALAVVWVGVILIIIGLFIVWRAFQNRAQKSE
jgi:hypothetical protein